MNHSKHIQEIGSLGIALAGIGGAAVYKRFLSDAARKCNHFFGAKKTICMLEHKLRAAKIMIKHAKTTEDQLMWKARIQKYKYQLTAARRKLQTQQRTNR